MRSMTDKIVELSRGVVTAPAYTGHSRPTPPRWRPAARLSSGHADTTSVGRGDTDSEVSQATVSPSLREPRHHFGSPARWPVAENSIANADIPALVDPPSRWIPASTALHHSPSNHFARALADEGRLPHTSRTTTASDTPRSAPLALDGRPRRHCPASPTNAAPPTRAGRSPFLDSCEPLSPIAVSLHGSSRLHCVPFGRPPRR